MANLIICKSCVLAHSAAQWVDEQYFADNKKN